MVVVVVAIVDVVVVVVVVVGVFVIVFVVVVVVVVVLVVAAGLDALFVVPVVGAWVVLTKLMTSSASGLEKDISLDDPSCNLRVHSTFPIQPSPRRRGPSPVPVLSRR